jgi:hypothetical protein
VNQGRRITPVAEEQGSRDARKKKGDELIQGLFCNFREKQGLN